MENQMENIIEVKKSEEEMNVMNVKTIKREENIDMLGKFIAMIIVDGSFVALGLLIALGFYIRFK